MNPMRPDSESAHRIHFPGLQPDRRPDGVRERRAAAHLPWHGGGRAARAGAGGAAGLGGAQRQRVGVAGAVVGDPAILLADEPTGNLDSSNGGAVMDLLRELHRNGATICMVTHDPRYAQHADRTVALFDGRVVEESGSGARGSGLGTARATESRKPSPQPLSG